MSGDNGNGNMDRRAALRWLAGSVPAAGLLAGCGPLAGVMSDSGSGGDALAGDTGTGGDSGMGGDAGFADAGGGDVGGTGVDGGTCDPTNPDALGPFHEEGAPLRTVLAEPDEPGDRVIISGVVRAADCVTPVEGAVVDVWHADASGVYHDAGATYRLRGQMLTDAQGRYEFETIYPGHYSGRPRHYHYMVSHPDHAPITTQLYFQGDPNLGPNDSCQQPTCDTSDPDRIIELTEVDDGGRTVMRGTFEISLGAR